METHPVNQPSRQHVVKKLDHQDSYDFLACCDSDASLFSPSLSPCMYIYLSWVRTRVRDVRVFENNLFENTLCSKNAYSRTRVRVKRTLKNRPRLYMFSSTCTCFQRINIIYPLNVCSHIICISACSQFEHMLRVLSMRTW